METLQIKKDAAIAAHENAKSSGKKLLEDLLGKKVFQKDIMQRIQTFEDICAEMGKDPEDYECKSSDPDDIAANALRQALLISRCYNEGKVLDWDDSSQSKYCHVYEKKASGWALGGVIGRVTSTYCGSRLYFQNRKHAEDAWNKFSHIYINLIK